MYYYNTCYPTPFVMAYYEYNSRFIVGILCCISKYLKENKTFHSR